MHKTGLLTLFCALILNMAPAGFRLFHSLTEATAADVAISVKTIETCPHHPHGCPKECLCPKTLVKIGETDGTRAENPGTLNEPSLVTCTEHGPQSLSPSFAVFLAETSGMIPVLTAMTSFVPDEKNSVPDFFRAPPQKIPIV